MFESKFLKVTLQFKKFQNRQTQIKSFTANGAKFLKRARPLYIKGSANVDLCVWKVSAEQLQTYFWFLWTSLFFKLILWWLKDISFFLEKKKVGKRVNITSDFIWLKKISNNEIFKLNKIYLFKEAISAS